jgi:peptide-O-fucosyltransferase
LRKIGDKFRQEMLNSDDEKDSTVLKKDWHKNKKKEGSAVGGPYLAVHLRRADFLYARKNFVPTLDGTVKQIKTIMEKQKLDTVFLATDAPESGKIHIRGRLYEGRKRYPPDSDFFNLCKMLEKL